MFGVRNLQIRVAELTKNKGTTYKHEFLMPFKNLDEADMRAEEPVRVAIEAAYLGREKGIQVEGHFQSLIHARCHRCLQEFKLNLSGDFREEVQLDGESTCVRGQEAACLGESIDLAVLVREHLLLSVPLKLLCREDCRGICHMCGQDLSEKACTCTVETLDPRLEKLKELIKE